jgi:hypothetical protein
MYSVRALVGGAVTATLPRRPTLDGLFSSVPDAVWALPDDQLAAAMREACRYDPMLFAVWYLGHHLVDEATGGEITFSSFHAEMCRRALEWTRPTPPPRSQRHADIAPRESGKTTWKFLLLLLWAAAYGHLRFIAAFADAGPQAEMHLATFKRELANNERLRQDFPDLCTPGTLRGVSDSDTKSLYIAQSGFVFGAKGIDAKTLGMKVGARRPDMIVLDDIEPPESSYSEYQKEQRLKTLLDAILPLSIHARVELSGTTTMPGSITHDLIKSVAHAGAEVPEWVADAMFQVHHHLPFEQDEEGNEVSVWPEKWPTEFLLEIRHTRGFSLNYMNDPLAVDGAYWTRDSFRYGSTFTAARTLLCLDPAVTTKEKSDYTGVAVVAGNKAVKVTEDGKIRFVPRCRVEFGAQVKLAPGAPLRNYCLRLLETYPEIGGILVETNNGGDVWDVSVLHDMPVKVLTTWSDEPKEVRAAHCLGKYDRGQVEHARKLPAVETQMVGFPRGHDDIVDAVASGVRYFIPDEVLRERRRSTSQSYR